MPTQTLTRAWTDLDFRASLTLDDQAIIDHPAGDLNEELNQLIVQDIAETDTTMCTIWTSPLPRHSCCC